MRPQSSHRRPKLCFTQSNWHVTGPCPTRKQAFFSVTVTGQRHRSNLIQKLQYTYGSYASGLYTLTIVGSCSIKLQRRQFRQSDHVQGGGHPVGAGCIDSKATFAAVQPFDYSVEAHLNSSRRRPTFQTPLVVCQQLRHRVITCSTSR